jgi:FHA domain-containing protein
MRMSTYTCPKGCTSTDPDWCSECGASMKPAAAVPKQVASSAPSLAAPMLCPTCGTPRKGSGRFCGVCRYDFETGQAYSPRAATAVPPQVNAGAEGNGVAAATATAAGPASPASLDPTTILSGGGAPRQPWVVIIDFDPTVDPTSTPDISQKRPRLTFPLDLPEMLIGRAGSKSHPEIPIEDEGVSSRHAKILFTADGDPCLLELGSTNGTLVNNAPATAGLPVALRSGDQIVMGRWTRITIKTK